MARREWNEAGNGQFGRLAKSAGFRRNPNNTREPARSEIGIGGRRDGGAPATPPGMRVRTGRFESLRS
ncbi:MAG: hypothetical protein EBU75_08705 [Betaproteobacteria bacterium]|nr:hypothetical protein [Betaproteobacteria bacterium]